jgi:hypothetical protein
MRTHVHRWLPTAIALLALVVALGGPAAAGKKINGKSILKGTVASKQLKNLSVQGADVRNGTLTGAKVADGGLTGQDLADASLSGVDVTDASLSAADLAAASVTGQALDGSGTFSIDFATVTANTCSSFTEPLPASEVGDGSLSDDVILAKPDASFTGNFSYTVTSNGPLSLVVKMCNVGAIAVDPDGGIGLKPWQWAAIDIG